MVTTDFSGQDVVKALTKNKFRVIGREGSHVRLRYDHPQNEDDVRLVTVPMHDRTKARSLRDIADQFGAEE
jgi:predicted RNA binding protein YcfA (HicA-like mRNA interferase family)